MTNTLKSLNKFVVSFFQNNNIEADADWMDSSNQSAVKSLLTKALKCTGQVKDPNAPKRGKSAYLFFCSAMRSKVKEALSPEAKATDVTRELGIRWNLLKEDKGRAKELVKYQKQAAEDKARYDTERSEYVPDETLVKQGRIKKVNSGPKRAKSAYLYFCLDKREEVKRDLGDGSSATDITRELGARWNILKTEGSTKKYDDEAAEDKSRYYLEKEEGNEATPGKKVPAAKKTTPVKKATPVKKVTAAKEPAAKKEAPAKKEPPAKKGRK